MFKIDFLFEGHLIILIRHIPCATLIENALLKLNFRLFTSTLPILVASLKLSMQLLANKENLSL